MPVRREYEWDIEPLAVSLCLLNTQTREFSFLLRFQNSDRQGRFTRSCRQAEQIIHAAFATPRTAGYDFDLSHSALGANQIFNPAAISDFGVEEFLSSKVFVAWHIYILHANRVRRTLPW